MTCLTFQKLYVVLYVLVYSKNGIVLETFIQNMFLTHMPTTKSPKNFCLNFTRDGHEIQSRKEIPPYYYIASIVIDLFLAGLF